MRKIFFGLPALGIILMSSALVGTSIYPTASRGPSDKDAAKYLSTQGNELL
jgi:hypothetical protein